MNDNATPTADARAAVDALATTGACVLPSGTFSRILDATAEDWTRFGRNWEDLLLDEYMADGGRYRYRRYGQYDLDPQGSLTLLPHEPYRQESRINRLNGGVDRVFEPLTDHFTHDPLLTRILVRLGRIFSAVDGTDRWNIKLHPYRIVAGREVGQPAPEGRHQDGVTFITTLLINRVNVTGGESSAFTPEGDELVRGTLSAPGDLFLGDDRTIFHDVTPIHPVDPQEAAHRDVLVIAYTAR
ncbi:2OG-Fe dioxygenase family protein [Streptomyces sp. CT34]|uniref:2OG-Fe dioxygenase family protein n=1 Tax=Streptomyces sp. CT34 TaxID=1553907 RepID=UPI0005BD9F73|nr:2OG-Fe dioxygenase family protein [Streptomyces sp. CT34]